MKPPRSNLDGVFVLRVYRFFLSLYIEIEREECLSAGFAAI
jgi:hypothetical protein